MSGLQAMARHGREPDRRHEPQLVASFFKFPPRHPPTAGVRGEDADVAAHLHLGQRRASAKPGDCVQRAGTYCTAYIYTHACVHISCMLRRCYTHPNLLRGGRTSRVSRQESSMHDDESINTPPAHTPSSIPLPTDQRRCPQAALHQNRMSVAQIAF